MQHHAACYPMALQPLLLAMTVTVTVPVLIIRLTTLCCPAVLHTTQRPASGAYRTSPWHHMFLPPRHPPSSSHALGLFILLNDRESVGSKPEQVPKLTSKIIQSFFLARPNTTRHSTLNLLLHHHRQAHLTAQPSNICLLLLLLEAASAWQPLGAIWAADQYFERTAI